MINYCPECGIKLEKEYKFCPNCGTSFGSEKGTGAGKFIICSNCGEENPASNYECSSCGISLKKGRPDRSGIKNVQRKTVKVKDTPAQKSLDLTKLIAIFAGVIGIAIIILVISGVFDNPVPESRTSDQVQSSGVNLSAIQQINDMEKKVQADPGNLELQLEFAHLLNDNGFYDRAITNYRQYLEKNPSNADARIDMGVCYYNLKQYDTAISEMKKALEYKPNHQIGHLNLGIVNLAANRMDESKKWLEKAVAIDPGSEVGKRAEELLKNH